MVLFIQGGGNGGYEADAALVNSLQTTLGKAYAVSYPELQSDESRSDFGWPQQIAALLAATKERVYLVGHSLGASMILKVLSENKIEKTIAGIFLIATPFWTGDEDWKSGLKLQENFAEKLAKDVPLFFYHCKDDEEVPFSQLSIYKKHLPQAVFREIPQGGHRFNNDLTLVAQDIQSLS